MSARTSIAGSRRRRRTVTVIWATVLTVLIISLIYWEQTAVLYILATLGVAALLAVVAYADLGSAEKVSLDRINRDD